jgi:hypothetical protein
MDVKRFGTAGLRYILDCIRAAVVSNDHLANVLQMIAL